MSGDIHPKSYAVPLMIVVGVVALLFAVNRLISRQMNDLAEQTKAVQAKENSAVPVAGMRDSRHGIPEIDPLNDPLAPVTHTTNPFKDLKQKNPPKEESSSSEKVFEFPQSTPNLLQ